MLVKAVHGTMRFRTLRTKNTQFSTSTTIHTKPGGRPGGIAVYCSSVGLYDKPTATTTTGCEPRWTRAVAVTQIRACPRYSSAVQAHKNQQTSQPSISGLQHSRPRNRVDSAKRHQLRWCCLRYDETSTLFRIHSLYENNTPGKNTYPEKSCQMVTRPIQTYTSFITINSNLKPLPPQKN